MPLSAIEIDTFKGPIDISNPPEEIPVMSVMVSKEAPAPETTLSESDIDLLATITMAEAGNQTEYGQRLVIDVVLNRIDSDQFPDTVHGVVWQRNQFTPTIDGRIHQCYPREDIRQLVIEELQNRTNHDVIFFRTGRYSSYGTPMFKEDDHYFSSI